MGMPLIEVIRRISLEHPARTIPFDKLIEKLRKEISKGNVGISYHPRYPDLALFQLTLKCYRRKAWNPWNLMARGLVIDIGNKRVVATPFIKFFNYNELDIPSGYVTQDNITVTEQLDGTMGVLFNYHNEWIMSSNRSFQSPACQWALEQIRGQFPERVDKGNTYLFEILPPTAIVKFRYKYDCAKVVLIGIIDSFGLEYPYHSLVEEAKYLSVPVVQSFNFNRWKDAIEEASIMVKQREGFVVRDNTTGIRLKIKGTGQTYFHSLSYQLAPLTIWRAFLDGENLEERAAPLPPELQKDFWKIFYLLKKSLDRILSDIELMNKNMETRNDQELGMLMQTHPEAFKGGDVDGDEKFIFYRRRGTFYNALHDCNSLTRRRIFNLFRPTNNKLSEYVPSRWVRELTDSLVKV